MFALTVLLIVFLLIVFLLLLARTLTASHAATLWLGLLLLHYCGLLLTVFFGQQFLQSCYSVLSMFYPARTLLHCAAQFAECPARVVCAVPAASRSDGENLELFALSFISPPTLAATLAYPH